jgi:tetratricopeptide (TPR) repeat protein
MAATEARTIPEGMQVGGWPGMYVLGCLDRRVTIYSQQVRALNLAAALVASERVKPGESVVVVGAGAAGLTCAAGLRRLGVAVVVLEAQREILPLFRGGSTRWLHPGVYDWPLERWDRDRAGLPVLDWEHGTVDAVRKQLEVGWASAGDGVVVHRNVRDVKLGRPGDARRTVTWIPSGRQHTTTVILAVGFGFEPTPLPTERRYWEGDDLDASRVDGHERRWLVSGCGDGGLTELFRLCIDGFRHDRMLLEFTSEPRMRNIEEEIRRIEADAAIQDDPMRLHEAYADLHAPWIVEAMRARGRHEHVELAASTADFLNRGASPLNRFLAGQLHSAGGFELIASSVTSVHPDGAQVVVGFEDETSKRYDRIVRRHGPESALARGFPAIARAMEVDRAARRSMPTLMDRTRERFWEEGAFGAEVENWASEAMPGSAIVAASGRAATPGSVGNANAKRPALVQVEDESVIPSLSEDATRVLCHACELILRDDLIFGFIEGGEDLLLNSTRPLSREDCRDSISLLVEEGYVAGTPVYGAGQEWLSFTVTARGFCEYATMFIRDFDSRKTRLIQYLIEVTAGGQGVFSSTLATDLHEIHAFVCFVLQELIERGLLQGDRMGGGEWGIAGPSARLKRDYGGAKRDIQPSAQGPTPVSSPASVLPRAEQGPQDERAVWPGNEAARVEARPEPPKVAPTRLPHNATELFGREEELRQLDAEWASSGTDKLNVAVIVAWGGVGKTSLVFEWMNRLAADGYRGATAVFDWSFYSQGVRERGAASGDQFVREALRFFGDEAMADGTASAWDKGARLAELVGRQRALLVLDGLEPLQQPPGHAVAAGKLTDPAIAALLRGLARKNAGLCVVTTRETVEDLEGFGKAVSQRKLERLSEDAGVDLLRSLIGEARVGKPEVASTKPELAAIWKAVDGHALTLSLLGRYLGRRRWDVKRWREIRFEEADGKVQGGHAFRMLGAYERWLGGEDGEAMPGGQRMLAVLRILGLFDRAADPGCIGALCEGEAIVGLTEPLVGLDEGDWAEVLADLEALGLVSREAWALVRIEGFPKARTDLDTGETTGAPEVKVMPGWSQLTESLEAHPLVREHFGRRVRQTSEAAWKEGHRRVFEHLCESTPYWPDGEEGLRPLYQAVAHGCQAGEVEKACIEVYVDRVLRGTSAGGFYSKKKLGLIGADLGAVAGFFESPWSLPSSSLAEAVQAWLLNEAGFSLRALGRLAEAEEPMRASMDMDLERNEWKGAAISAGNLSELKLARGEVTAASRVAEQSVTFADRDGDAFVPMINRTTHANALHQAGRRDEAQRRFEEAEAIQAERQPYYPQLYSVWGFRYCDLLLFEAEHAAWRKTLTLGEGSSMAGSEATSLGGTRSSTPNDTMADNRALAACDDVLGRATQTLEWVTKGKLGLLDIALDHLTLGRAALYQALLAAPARNVASGPIHPAERRPVFSMNLAIAKQHLDAAVEGLRSSGQMDHLPRGLLTRAWLHHLTTNPTAAITDLDEGESIATRSGMPIFLADVHLTRARLFRDRTELAKARRLLLDLRARGYHRHDEMLADAEAAAKSWPA